MTEKNNHCDLYKIVNLVEEQTQAGSLNLEEIKKHLNNQIRLRVVPRDEEIASRGGTPAYVHYVISGAYFLYRISKQGKVNFLSVEHGPQWLGIDRAIDMEYANDTGDRVLKTCTVLDIRAGYFARCMEEDGSFASCIIKNLLRKISRISSKSDRLLFSDAREHLLFYILEYWERNHRGAAICRVEMKNEYIAEEIGVSLRTVYRTLNKLKEEELIEVVHGTIQVDRQQIQRIRDLFPEMQ